MLARGGSPAEAEARFRRALEVAAAQEARGRCASVVALVLESARHVDYREACAVPARPRAGPGRGTTMGLLDQVLREILRQQGGAQQPQVQSPAPQPQSQQTRGGGLTQAQLIALVSAAVAMLNDPRIGGIDGLVKRFQQSGLGDLITSWISTGENQPIDGQQLGRTLPDELSQITEKAGVPRQEGESILARILPQLIDQLTPGGQVPQPEQLDMRGAELLKGLFR